jgi:hypothetical protein
MHPVKWFVTRRRLRKQRLQLGLRHRSYLDRTVADVFAEANDETEFKQFFEAKVRHDSSRMGFDPMTILLMVELAILIYKLLKHFNVLAPTPEYVAFLIDEDE